MDKKFINIIILLTSICAVFALNNSEFNLTENETLVLNKSLKNISENISLNQTNISQEVENLTIENITDSKINLTENLTIQDNESLNFSNLTNYSNQTIYINSSNSTSENITRNITTIFNESNISEEIINETIDNLTADNLSENISNSSMRSFKISSSNKPKLIKHSDNDYQIRINGEKITYNETDYKKLSRISLNSKSESSSNLNKHYLVQFYKKLTKYEIESLKNEGVNVLDNMGNNAYYVSFENSDLLETSSDNKFENVDSSLKIDNYLNSDNALRSIETIDSDFKLSRNLKNGNIGNWSYDDEGNVYLNVQFHKDVTLNDAEKLMNDKGFEVLSRIESINTLTIKIKGGEKSE